MLVKPTCYERPGGLVFSHFMKRIADLRHFLAKVTSLRSSPTQLILHSAPDMLQKFRGTRNYFPSTYSLLVRIFWCGRSCRIEIDTAIVACPRTIQTKVHLNHICAYRLLPFLSGVAHLMEIGLPISQRANSSHTAGSALFLHNCECRMLWVVVGAETKSCQLQRDWHY